MEQLAYYKNLAEQAKAFTAVCLVVELAFGVLNCFFGYKLLKVWIALCGFLIGTGTGFLVISRFSDNSTVVLAGMLAVGVVAGILAYQVYLVGAFFLGWLMTVSVVVAVSRSMEAGDKKKLAIMAAGVVLGILVGVLIVKFARPCIIVLTGISGGISAASSLLMIFEQNKMGYMMITGVVMAAAGIGVQFVTTRRHGR